MNEGCAARHQDVKEDLLVLSASRLKQWLFGGDLARVGAAVQCRLAQLRSESCASVLLSKDKSPLENMHCSKMFELVGQARCCLPACVLFR